jgi:hypothetical protein
MFSTGSNSGAFGGSGGNCDVGWHFQLARDVPACLIEQQHRMSSWSHSLRGFDQMQRGSTRLVPLR